MTYQPSYQSPQSYLPPRKLSITSMLSLIFGILGCVPFVTGLLAVVLGIVGLIRTHNPAKSGRWMAILGLVLGCISLALWGLFGGVIGGGIYAAWKGTAAPRATTHDFIKALADGNDAAADANSEGYSPEQLHDMESDVHAFGKFRDTTFTTFGYNSFNGVGTLHMTGTADFQTGPKRVEVDLHQAGGAWKVTELHIGPK